MAKLFAIFLLLTCYISGAQTNSLSEKIAALSGSYRHSPPCTECTGIQTTLTLDCGSPCNSGTFIFSEEALNTINGDKGSESKGTWAISDSAAPPSGPGIIIALTEDNTQGKYKNYFRLVDGSLEQLSKNKQPITPPFNIVLTKLPPGSILDLR